MFVFVSYAKRILSWDNEALDKHGILTVDFFSLSDVFQELRPLGSSVSASRGSRHWRGIRSLA